MKRRTAVFALLSSCLLVLALACSAPDTNARVNPDVGLRDRPSFEPVSRAMVFKCGTLDCHGSMTRNLRLFGYGGLRYALSATPDGIGTTQNELDQNYESIAGLEPETFTQVVNERGTSPERLALVAKPRSRQNHKGGPVMKPGDPIDVCITSWLEKAVNEDACLAVVPPQPDGGIPLPLARP